MNLQFWFYVSFFIIFYSYIGYGILVFCILKIRRLFFPGKTEINEQFRPEVTLVVAAYNEGDFIEQKIQNSLHLNYPAGKLKLIFITDGSTDDTMEIVRQHPAVLLLHEKERRGKVAAMNRAIKHVQTPYTVFCDANTLLNTDCIVEIVKHFANPRVGAVAGEKKIITGKQEAAAGAGEGLYWKYESYLKNLDSQLHTVVGAAGELFSIRTSLFHQTSEDTIIEDFVQSLRVCQDGYVVKYEPAAYAMETSSASMKEEQKRKVRIAAGAFQAMYRLRGLLNVFKYPVLSFQYISHRVLRWTLCPICLILFFLSNLGLVLSEISVFYDVIFLVQIIFYTLAGIGWFFANRNLKIKAFFIPYYFLFMNLSVFIGFSRFIRKTQSAVWEKSVRGKLS